MSLLRSFKNKCKLALNSKAMLWVRWILNIKPHFVIRPPNEIAPISDLFFWKQDEHWETVFNLINIGTSILPDKSIHDKVTLFVWNDAGQIIIVKTILLFPHEMQKIYFSDLSITGKGAFACFHQINENQSLMTQGSHIIDRGYVGYRKDRGLWSFVHGNLIASYLDVNKTNTVKGMLVTRFIGRCIYKPQVSFEDCERLSIILINGTNKNQKIQLQLKMTTGETVIKKVVLKNFSVEEITIDNSDKLIQQAFVLSKIFMFRPLVIKYYSHYFDAFHA